MKALSLKQPMKNFGFANLPLGQIVGKAILKDVKKYNSDEEHQADKDLHLASGRYGFIIENVQRIKLIECNGKLNF
ncbi:hypothetical protein J4229_02070 [Candidatus Pacearchaeota archaeon]|nr:hypothetical protein [Candidatus Pacearchaeota archaeon]